MVGLTPIIIASHRHTFVVPINRSSFIVLLMGLVIMTYLGIRFSVIMTIGLVIGISNWGIVPSIRLMIHHMEPNNRPCKIPVERSVYIMTIIDIDVSTMVAIMTSVVVIHI